MAELKTQVNDADVLAFLNAVENDRRRTDGLALYNMMKAITGLEPKMWGDSIVGYGSYHYTSTRSKQAGDWPAIGFSPRKASLSLYIMNGFSNYEPLLKKLGKHKLGKGCLYINKLDDVDLNVLKTLVQDAFEAMNGRSLTY
ncbi:DUF1801 domain-containing protein [Fusibacter sp. JL298sf-3]